MTLLGRALLALLLLCAAPLAAQSTGEDQTQSQGQTASGAPDLAQWDSVASRAEKSVADGDAFTHVYETLRTRIATYRAEFDKARKANSDRIKTLKSQIEALGPAPEDPGAEAQDIAARRSQLNQQLQEIQAPAQAAEEAYTRADGLIKSIDKVIRQRQTERLLSLGPSPLNPTIWPQTASEFTRAIGELVAEQTRVVSDATLRAQARARAPLTIFLVLVGILLLTRATRIPKYLANHLRRTAPKGIDVWLTLTSLLSIALPVLGLFALVNAAFASTLVGSRMTRLLDILPYLGAILVGFHWLSARLFSPDDHRAVLPLPATARTEARFYVSSLGYGLIALAIVELFFEQAQMTLESGAVSQFPIIVCLAIVMFRLGQLLRYIADPPEDDEEEPTEPTIRPGRARVVRVIGILCILIGISAPIMAGIGYLAAGQALMFPMIGTLAVLGLAMVLQRFIGDLLGWLKGTGPAERDSLSVVLLGFGLLVATTPIIALFWGARTADLTELWSMFLNGFAVGETTISPANFVTFALIFTGGYILTRLVQGALETSVLPKTRIDPGGQNALVSGVGYLGIFLAALVAVTSAGIDLSNVALVAGALSVGIGFGLQNVVSNFVSGIILLIERPITEGDWIEVNGTHGTVRNISVRSTRVETFNRSDVIIPNADLVSGSVINYTRGNTVGRIILPIGVAYGTDTRRVERILREIVESHPMVMMRPPPSVLFRDFGASSLDFEIRAILRDINWGLSVRSELNHQIAERFVQEGIEIPFPQQDLWLRNANEIVPQPEQSSTSGHRMTAQNIGEISEEPDLAGPDEGDAAR